MIDRAQVDQLLESDVVDARGEKIGAVRQVWLDDRTGAPLWAEVHTGLFGMRDTFVPIQDASIGDGRVMVPLEKKQVKDSPNINVHGGHMSDEQQEELYRHYGMTPQARTGDHDRLSGGPHRDGRAGGQGGRMDAAGTGTGMRDTGRKAPGRDDTGRGAAVTRHEEELRAGVRDVEAGRVRLVKHVVTEQQEISVPVKREEVRVVREPVEGGKADRDAFSESQAELTLHREEPVVEKTVRPVEKVRLDKETVTDEQKVSGTVRKERVDVQDDTGRTRDHRRTEGR